MDLRAISYSSKKEKRYGDQGINNISNLPKNVVDHILSFLSFVDVVKMSILSRRWLYTWTSISNIILEDKIRSYQNVNDLIEFVDRVLTLHDDSDIKGLKLWLNLPEKFPRLNKWISVAINHNIQELDLFIGLKQQKELPCWLFSCQSLVMLKIHALLTIRAPPCTFFLNLKKLSLNEITFSDDKSTQRIFSGCPVLEELALIACIWTHIKNVTISIATLKSLTIDHFDEKEAVFDCTIKITSINLTNFSCWNDMKVNIDMCELLSLDSARVDTVYSEGDTTRFFERARSLFSAICNVKVLEIMSPETLTYIVDRFDIWNYLPTFHKLTYLRVGAEQPLWGSSIILFLQKTPQLEHLDIFESHGDDGFERIMEVVPSCFKTSLAMCSFFYFRGSHVEMQLIEFVLINAILLKRMILSCDRALSTDKLRKNVVQNRINMLGVVCKSCVIEWRETS